MPAWPAGPPARRPAGPLARRAKPSAGPQSKTTRRRGAGWRGRAQSIVVLRQQNKQLQQQLKQLQNLDYRSSRDAKDVDLRNRADLRAMEEARRAATERMGEELASELKRSAKLESQLKAAHALKPGDPSVNTHLHEALDERMSELCGTPAPDAAPAPAPSPAPAAADQHVEAALEQLKAMGFDDEAANRRAIEAAQGDVQTALAMLLG